MFVNFNNPVWVLVVVGGLVFAKQRLSHYRQPQGQWLQLELAHVPSVVASLERTCKVRKLQPSGVVSVEFSNNSAMIAYEADRSGRIKHYTVSLSGMWKLMVSVRQGRVAEVRYLGSDGPRKTKGFSQAELDAVGVMTAFVSRRLSSTTEGP